MFKFAKRILLFMAVNFLIMITISIVLNLLGVQPYLNRNGINYQDLAVFCLVWGMGGAFISLALSRVMAKMMMGVKTIDPNTASGPELFIYKTVEKLALQSGFSRVPEVGIYQSPEINAFATGPTQNRSLVAVSSGLLQQMSKEQIEGVLAHEMTHISNGDMVTMTLVQGVVNAFVMFLARVIAFAISQNVKEEARASVRFAVTFALEILLSFLGMILVASFSRWREFRADKGGAQLAGKANMISALTRLNEVYGFNSQMPVNQSLAAFKISGKKGFLSLFSSHPPLEERIRRLQADIG